MSKKRRNKSRRKQRGTNRQYKDRLFKALFGSPERKDLTLALYNALRGSSYTNPQDIRLTTIDDVVYICQAHTWMEQILTSSCASR